MKYKILFAGLGSIGKRHLRNVIAFLESRNDEYVIDAVRSGNCNTIDTEIGSFISNYYTYEQNLPNDYDILFVTNPTVMHYETIRRYTGITKHMFIEKPVFDRYDYNIDELRLNPQSIYYVACPLRYNAVLQYIKENIECSKAIAVRSICSSYLPDWRPRQDYRKTYSAHRDMGGGVAIDLIHEWDYLTWLFGMPEKVSCIIGQHSGLEINSDDIAIYIAKRGKLTFELHLDYFGKKTIRQLQVFMPEETIEADISNGEVRYLVERKAIFLHEDRNVFQLREIQHFFDIIEGKCKNDNDIKEAVAILKIAEGRKE